MTTAIQTDDAGVTSLNGSVRHLTLCKEPDEGGVPHTNEAEPLTRYDWDDDAPAARSYSALGELLAQGDDLYRHPRHGSGLLLVHRDGKHEAIRTGADLAPVIVDRIDVTIHRDGKVKGSRIAPQHLNTMLRTEVFLPHFRPMDQITSVPVYLPDFSLARPGYNDGGLGHRYLYTGDHPRISASLDRINAFLDVMAFESNADRTNALAAALTVSLRNHWPGGKPIVLGTATKSHRGKDTVIMFASGVTRQCSISYQATDWALERSLVGALNQNPETGVVVIENARLDRMDQCIASAFVERAATDPEPLLFSTGTGPAARRRNDLVLAISTNFGTVSEDILNRSLPIHLTPVGNIADRDSPIGNPKLEYLPTYREDIAAELRDMIKKWKDAGMPLDKSVRHPFSVWAKTIGGILGVNGFKDFLGNYGTRKVNDDPVRNGLGLLGAELPGEDWNRADEWARRTVKLGLVKQIIPPGDQDTGEGRKRGIGVVLSAHRDETFAVETETEALMLRLERKRARFGPDQPHVRYRFAVIDRKPIESDDDD
jgi:hypothetical protein